MSQVVDADEILWHLGPEARERVVGISKMADDARYSGIAGVWPDTVDRVPGSSEALLAAKPDLVIVSEFSVAETRALLEASNVPTLVLEGFDGFDDYRRRVSMIGESMHLQDQAKRLVSEFDAKLAELRRRVERSAPAVVSWIEGNVAGTGTTFHDVASAAGLRNLAAEKGVAGHRNVPLEQVVAWDPEAVVTICGTGECEKTAADLAARPGWSATQAARSERIMAIPGPILLSPGRGMLQAVERLRALHEAS